MRTGRPNNRNNTAFAASISSGGYKSAGNHTSSPTRTNHKTSIATITRLGKTTSFDHIRTSTVHIILFTIALLLTACGQQPAPMITVTVQLPDSLTNLLKPNFIQPQPDPDFQIIKFSESRAFTLERHSGRIWELVAFTNNQGRFMYRGWSEMTFQNTQDETTRQKWAELDSLISENKEYLRTNSFTKPSAAGFLDEPISTNALPTELDKK